ncbi:hypothetical protein [Achromobacter xylosoxidans]|uniref:hypothetical protein n=1 Tax=Alcaligenes xylosoxydans xylosoxydans TaxID=85698 RepID=UPI0013F4CB0D|nr:hypothetical protein [Achromobacter xylosoxidans]
MNGVTYLFCWAMVLIGAANIWQQQWAFAAVSFGMSMLVIADALIDAIKEAGKK